jgi:chromosome segregation ATPase
MWIKEAAYDFMVAMTPTLPPQLEGVKSCICSNPLVNRVSTNWKVLLMDCSTIISTTCVVLAFLEGATLLCGVLAIVAFASAVSSYYMRHYAALTDLETTATRLRETNERIEASAASLQVENTRLTENNRVLERNNEAIQSTNRDLQATNQAFQNTNGRLTQQVTSLALQVTQLRESADRINREAERIQGEVLRFNTENSALGTNVQGFSDSLTVLTEQIAASRGLCEQITNHLSTQQSGLGQQLTQLGTYLTELRSQNGVNERRIELDRLREQALQQTTLLGELRVQYAAERARFEAIGGALNLIREQFATTLATNNQQFASERERMDQSQQRMEQTNQRIEQLLNQYFPNNVPTQGNNVPNLMQTGHPVTPSNITAQHFQTVR